MPGPPGDDDERRFLGVGARDRVEKIEAAGAVRHDADAEAIGDARGAVGGESDGRLVAECDELEPAVLRKSLVQVEDEVSGNAENVPYALRVDFVEEDLMKFHAPEIIEPASLSLSKACERDSNGECRAEDRGESERRAAEAHITAAFAGPERQTY